VEELRGASKLGDEEIRQGPRKARDSTAAARMDFGGNATVGGTGLGRRPMRCRRSSAPEQLEKVAALHHIKADWPHGRRWCATLGDVERCQPALRGLRWSAIPGGAGCFRLFRRCDGARSGRSCRQLWTDPAGPLNLQSTGTLPEEPSKLVGRLSRDRNSMGLLGAMVRAGLIELEEGGIREGRRGQAVSQASPDGSRARTAVGRILRSC